MALLLLGVLWFTVSALKRADIKSVLTFAMLIRPSTDHIGLALIGSAGLLPALVVGLGIAAVGARRGLPTLAAVIVVLVGANLTTEVLKVILPARGALFVSRPLGAPGSFPSGHTTSCMALVLAAMLAAPARRRWLVAGAGALYAPAVGYALLMLGDHYPSDVVAGYLVALLWALVAVAGMQAVDGPRRRDRMMPRSGTAAAIASVLGSLALTLAGVIGVILLHPTAVSAAAFGASATAIAVAGCLVVGTATLAVGAG